MTNFRTNLLSCFPVVRWGGLMGVGLPLEPLFIGMVAFSTVLAEMGEINVGGFSFRGWAWMMVLMASVFFLLPHGFRLPVRCNWWVWVPWILWMVHKTEFSNRDAAQRFFIFLTPILTLFACSSFKQISIVSIRKSIRFLALFSIILYFSAVLSSGSLMALAGWYTIAGIAMTFTLLAVSESTDLKRASPMTWILLGIYYMILLFTESRMPLLVLPFIVIFGYNALTLSVKCTFGAIVLLLGIAAFYTEPVQQNIFHQGHGSLLDLISFDPEVVNLSGRLNAWPQFLAGIENRWMGDGATSSAEFGYATFRGWTHTHNEYLRILFDYGRIGFILLTIPVIELFVTLIRGAARHRFDPQARWLYAASINGLLAMLLLGISGNVLMYVSYIGNMLFVLIGCTYAIRRNDL